MRDVALHWAESVLEAPVTDTVKLEGGVTSTMIALTGADGARSVLRLMTNQPWRADGPELTQRERTTQLELADSPVPAPMSIAIDADGRYTGGVPAHLMSFLPGSPINTLDDSALRVMAEMLATIHDFTPTRPFRPYQSWAGEHQWFVPAWSRYPDGWERAFAQLRNPPPDYEPVTLHRDYSHRNLLWVDGAISGVVDWVETSTGPADLDVGHAASNLAMALGPEPAEAFIAHYEALTNRQCNPYWLIMDSVGFLAPPGQEPLFGSAAELHRLDEWVHTLTVDAPHWL